MLISCSATPGRSQSRSAPFLPVDVAKTDLWIVSEQGRLPKGVVWNCLLFCSYAVVYTGLRVFDLTC